jgi:hypothetical protein
MKDGDGQAVSPGSARFEVVAAAKETRLGVEDLLVSNRRSI